MDPNKQYSFPTAMLDFFGKRPGKESAADFMAELKALDDNDRKELRELLIDKGYKLS